jgi:predicted dehydrogenase
MIRFGLAGCGMHANWAVVPAIRGAGERCRLAAVCDVNAENLARIDAAGAARFADHRAMIAAGGLDAVYVATLVDSHARIAIDALGAGLHVVCEKPMAASVEECRAMLAAAERAGRLLAINFETRYHASSLRIRRWIREGRLGRVEAIHAQNLWDGHKVFGPIGARRKRLTDLAGALDCGVHKADLIRFFCGGNWKEVRAMGRWFGEDVAKPPHISVLASLDNGVLATLNASFAYTAYIPGRLFNDVLTIVGTHGVVSHMGDMQTPSVVKLVSADLTEEVPWDDASHDHVMVSLLNEFCDVAEGRKPAADAVFATGQDGLMAQVFVEEANRQALAEPGAARV